ncbi:MAG TPA: hypothetical protein DCX29_14995, partial [Hyphomonas sp.]|nr:hypothetical protein [Hyphomonas sp.]
MTAARSLAGFSTGSALSLSLVLSPRPKADSRRDRKGIAAHMSKPFDGWTIVFDLDGTLVNTAPDLLEALNHVLTNADLTPVTLDTIATMIGHGARAMIVKGLLAHGITPSDSDLDVFLEQFLDYYAANIADHSHAFDGVVEAMTTLSA